MNTIVMNQTEQLHVPRSAEIFPRACRYLAIAATFFSGAGTGVGQIVPPGPPSDVRVGAYAPMSAKPSLAIQVDAGEWSVLRKVPVTDCRVVRGFFGAAVDGSTNSWDYAGNVGEYPQFSTSSKYDYNNNDGLHVMLADPAGFDVAVLRGGAQARMYTSAPASITEPTNISPLCSFAGSASEQVVSFGQRVRGNTFALYGTRNGSISDISFYQKSTAANPPAGATLFRVGGLISLPAATYAWQPDSIARGLVNRYPTNSRVTLSLNQSNPTGAPLSVSSNAAVHFITPPFLQDTGLVSVAVDLSISGASVPARGVVAVQDPLDPQLDVSWVDFTLTNNGRIQLVLDIPDQVLLANSQVWITLRLDSSATVAGPDGGAPQVWLQLAPTQSAFDQALAWRKFLLKTFVSQLSESRPWATSAFTNAANWNSFLATLASGDARRCAELFYTLDNCYRLAPTDSTILQYRDWVYLYPLRPNLSAIAALPPAPSGVPAWAWYSRQAWLDVRGIAQWWLTRRATPDGGLGGLVSDDGDWYQEFSDLPFFETDGVGLQIKTNAANLAETAVSKYLVHGVNKATLDSLHAYEEGINTLALTARWFYGDPVYVERAMESARYMQNLTTLVNGRRWFRNQGQMGYSATNAPLTTDGYASALMWQTALQVADYNRNSTALGQVTDWANSWAPYEVHGSWATEINLTSMTVVSSSPSRPLNGYGQAPVFTWLDALTATRNFSSPFFDIYTNCVWQEPAIDDANEIYALGFLDGVPPGASCLPCAATHTDQTPISYGALFNPALAVYSQTNTSLLISVLQGSRNSPNDCVIDDLYSATRWPDIYTSAELFVDRIEPHLLQWASAAYLGGYTFRNKFNPSLAVSWGNLGTNYAALVLDHRKDRLTVAVYNFLSTPLTGTMRVWELEHGSYQLTAGPDLNQDFQMDSVARSETRELAKADTIDFTFPGQQVTLIQLRQLSKLDSIFNRADLALSSRELTVTNGVLTGYVHNLGSQAITNVVLTVTDANNSVVTNASLGPLDAPLDLVARQKAFSIPLGSAAAPLQVTVSSQEKAPELYQGNNAVVVSY